MRSVAQAAPPVQRDHHPYQDLYSFGEERSAWFFGRAEEQRGLITQVRTCRLTVLYAESGVGKSSLLRAGVTARLHQLAVRDYRDLDQALLVPVFFDDWKDDPRRDLRHAVAVQSAEFAAPPVEALDLEDGPLVDTLKRAAAEVRTTLLIILDQFEEHLGRVRAQGGSSPFIAELIDCLADPTLDVSFLIGVREDAFGKVDNLFHGHVAGERSNTHLSYLTRAAASDAITLPVTKVYNRDLDEKEQVGFEPGLVEEVIKQVHHRDDIRDLTRGDGAAMAAPNGSDKDEIEAPFLQLVMTRLWERESSLWERETADQGQRTLRLETFQSDLGGATQIVANHLHKALHGLSAQEIAIATGVFDELVTASGTKLALTPTDLAKKTKHDPPAVESVLQRLDDSRILRSVDAARDGEERRYEVFHDRFTEPIQQLLFQQERERNEQARQAAEDARLQAEAQALKDAELRTTAEENAQLAKENAEKAHRRAFVARVAAVCCFVLGIVAFVLWREAGTQRDRARVSAAQAALSGLKTAAQADLGTRPDVSLLLLLAAHQLAAGSPAAVAAEQRNVAALLQTSHGSGTSGILHGHTDAIESVAFSPDGDTLATGSADKTIRLWHVTAASHTPMGHVVKTQGSVFGVAFSPDGSTLAAATFDEVQLWNVARGSQTAHYQYGAGKLITSVAFSPTGRLVGMGTADGRVVLWDPGTNAHWVLPTSTGKQVKSVAFSHDGSIVAAASGTSVFLWEAANRKSGGRLTNHRTPAAIAFSPAGNTLAVAGNRYVTLWTLPPRPPFNQPTQTRTARSSSQLLYSVAFSRDGTTVAAGGGGRAVIIDAATGAIGHVLSGPPGALYGIAFSRTGTTLAAGGADRAVYLWRLPVTSHTGLPIAHVGRINTVAVSPDGRLIVSAGRRAARPGFIAVMDTAHSSKPQMVSVRHPIENVAFSPRGQELAVATGNGTIQLWDPIARRLLRSWTGTPTGPSPSGPARSQADATTPPVYSVAFNHDGTELVSGGADGSVRLWHLTPQGVTGRLIGREFGAVYAVAVSGTTVAAASADHAIHLWNLAAPAGPETIPLDDSVFGLAFSPHGTALAAAGADDTIRLWRRQTSTYALRSVLLGHLALVRSVAFSPDGTTLVSGGSDNSVRLWDVATGEEVGSPFTVDTKSVEGVAYSPNGEFFSGSLDGELRQWDAVTIPSTFAELSRQVCAFVGAGLNRTEWKTYAPNIPYRKTCARATPGS